MGLCRAGGLCSQRHLTVTQPAMNPARSCVILHVGGGSYDINHPSLFCRGGCSCSGRGDRPSRLGRIRHVQVVHRSPARSEIDLTRIHTARSKWRSTAALALRPGAAFAHGAARHQPTSSRLAKTCTCSGYPHTTIRTSRIEYIIVDGKRVDWVDQSENISRRVDLHGSTESARVM